MDNDEPQTEDKIDRAFEEYWNDQLPVLRKGFYLAWLDGAKWSVGNVLLENDNE